MPLPPMYGGGTVRGGYDAAQDQFLQKRAADMQNMQGGMGILSQLAAQQERQRQMQEMEQLKPILAQSGGDPQRAIQALIATGQPKAIELAAKLHSLIPKPEGDRVVAPGGALVSPQGKVKYQAPAAPGSEPEVVKLTKMLESYSEGHPARKVIEGRIAHLSGGSEKQSSLARLIAERDALPQGDPRRATYDAAITHTTNPQAQRIIVPPQPRNLQLTTDAEGNQLIVNPDGTTRPLTTETGTGIRKPVAADKPMTEFQGKAALYGTRAAQSDKVLKALEDKINVTGLSAAQSLGTAGNFLMSSEQQRVSQAQRDFVNAVLRQESGAVISDAEFANAKKQYFPAPGDNKATIDQKRANRQMAIRGFARMSGPKGGVEIQSVLENPLLPGVNANPVTPQENTKRVVNFSDLK